MQKNILEKFAAEISKPCVTISMNTHRTHPDNAQDVVVLKNLLSEAKERLVKGFGKRDISSLLDKIENLEHGIDINYNLNSLHIFVSNATREIVKSPWTIEQNIVHISERFSIKPVIKIFNCTVNYLILLLSQSGVKLFLAINDSIADEIIDYGFPFAENLHFITDKEKLSDAKKVDNMVREFLNKVDKAVVQVCNAKEMHCMAICTEDNFSRLMQVADKPSVYLGHIHLNYNNMANHVLAASAWEMMKHMQNQSRLNAIIEMQQAVANGNVITDLSEIFRAAKEGRADLLIIQDGFNQPVKMTGDLTFDLVKDATQPDVIDDITNEIAHEVIMKKGRVLFSNEDELKAFGNIALKVRY
jgi:hypothetical protein